MRNTQTSPRVATAGLSSNNQIFGPEQVSDCLEITAISEGDLLRRFSECVEVAVIAADN